MNCQNCLWTIPKGITYTEELLAFQKTLPFIFLLKKKPLYLSAHISIQNYVYKFFIRCFTLVS
jgi:hypothetical protein